MGAASARGRLEAAPLFEIIIHSWLLFVMEEVEKRIE